MSFNHDRYLNSEWEERCAREDRYQEEVEQEIAAVTDSFAKMTEEDAAGWVSDWVPFNLDGRILKLYAQHRDDRQKFAEEVYKLVNNTVFRVAEYTVDNRLN